jgi:hypothetical protein
VTHNGNLSKVYPVAHIHSYFMTCQASEDVQHCYNDQMPASKNQESCVKQLLLTFC